MARPRKHRIDWDTLPHLLRMSQVVALTGLPRTAAYKAARAGVLPCHRIGRSIYVPRDALRRWLGQQAQAQQPATADWDGLVEVQ